MNSWKMARCGLAMTWESTLRRPRWAMPSTMSFMPSEPPRLMICSSAGISDSPPSRPKRLVPLYLTSMNCSKPSASISFDEDRLLALGGEGDLLVRAFDARLDPGLLLGVGDVHELDAERRAIGPRQYVDHLGNGRVFEPEHAVDEDLAAVVRLGEAVGGRRQLVIVLERLGDAERIEIGVQVAAHAEGADHHDGAHRIARRLKDVGVGDRSAVGHWPCP